MIYKCWPLFNVSRLSTNASTHNESYRHVLNWNNLRDINFDHRWSIKNNSWKLVNIHL